MRTPLVVSKKQSNTVQLLPSDDAPTEARNRDRHDVAFWIRPYIQKETACTLLIFMNLQKKRRNYWFIAWRYWI